MTPIQPPSVGTAGVVAPGSTVAVSGLGGLGGPAGGRGGVPLLVPLPFLLTGIGAAALFGVLLFWVAPDALVSAQEPHVLAAVHIATLGWLTMTVMGASLQLAPVILVTPLWAVRSLYALFPVFAGGVAVLVSGFWWMRPWLVVVGGTLVAAAVALYVVVLGLTLAHATTKPLTARYLMAALLYLCLVIGLGITAALNLRFGFLGAGLSRLLLAHITVGVVGWLTMTVIGVSYQLVRMFALAHGHSDRLGRVIFVALNVGLVALALAFAIAWWPLALLGGATLIGAAWLFAADYARMLRARRRKPLDITQRHGIAAVAYLALVIPLGVIIALLSWGRAAPSPGTLAALGLLALVGWFGQNTVGYLYKIVPFLVWNQRYGPLAGKRPVPLMRDLLRPSWAEATWWLINSGLPLAALSLALGWIWVLRLGVVLLGAGLALATINVAGVVWWHPAHETSARNQP